MDDDTHLGGKFWLGVCGAAIAVGIGALIIALFINMAWYLWGAIGTIIAIVAVTGLVAWYYDRRQQKRYEQLPT